jgi:hypothetical protein
MDEQNDNIAKYRIIKAAKNGKQVFVDISDEVAVETVRNQYGNQDLSISTCYFTAPDLSAPRIYPLYFTIASDQLETTRTNALEVIFYINESFQIPQDCIEIICFSSGQPNYGNETGGSGDNGKVVPATIVILTPPAVFDAQPTLFMPALDYHVARRILKDTLKNIDIDVYHRDYFIPLPNSIHAGSYIVPLTIKELLYLNADMIAELSKQPKPEDNLVMLHRISEAAEWFTENLKELTNKQKAQDELLKLMLQDGWQTPPCYRRLLWADLSKEQAVEACRVISQFFSWIKASPDEIWHHLQSIDRRNGIKDYQRLRAILKFAQENPNFVGCEHLLLKRFCPASKCFMGELFEKYERPYLF